MSQNWTADLYNAPHLLPESKQTIPIIQNLIAGTENAKDSASRVAAVFEDRIKNGNNETPNGLWVVFCTAVDRLGSDEKVITLLIDFLLSLASLDVLDASGNPIASNCNGDAFWSQLPGFSLVFRDELTSIDNTDSIADAQWAAEKRRFRNANAFQATWLGRVADRGPRRERLSAQTFALWHISSALDCGVPDTALGRRRTEMYVPQAAQWVLLAGAVVYRLSETRLYNGVRDLEHLQQ
ncbi:hypothetical protein GGS26DRAFT_592421 [Neofusicoccum parvum]|nr:hypothetical protein GGS26DRAFT_592421 [Neofusicoccum parvum]